MAACLQFSSDEEDEFNVDGDDSSLSSLVLSDDTLSVLLARDDHVKINCFTNALSHGNLDDDDGWVSDENQQQPHASDNSPTKVVEDSEVMFEDIRRAWLKNNKCSSPELVELIKTSFENLTDPYDLILCFIARTGKNRLQPNSISRIILSEFLKWRESKMGMSGVGVFSCDSSHQTRALQILEYCHHVLFDDIVKVFLLDHAKREELVSMVTHLIDCYRHTDAIHYATKLGIQEEFDVTEMLLPMVALDKTNIIENYLENCPKLQDEFMKYLEKLYMSHVELEKAKRHLIKSGIQFSYNNSKLTVHQLDKLITRLSNIFGLPISNYPKLFQRKALSSVNYLLHKKYIEGMLNDGSVLEAAVKDKPSLQQHLIMELISYNDLSAAAHYAQLYNISTDHLPPCLIEYISNNHSYTDSKPKAAAFVTKKNYYTLKLPLDKIVFVNDQRSFEICIQKLIKPGNIVALDSEWRLAVCNNGENRVSIFQLAVKDAVFILDTINLPLTIKHHLLASFIHNLFGSQEILKIGYQVQGDLALLAKTWPFAASVLSSPQRVVDLKYLSEKIFEKEPKVFNPFDRTSYLSCPGFPQEHVNSKGRGRTPLMKSHCFHENGVAISTSTHFGLSKLAMRCLGKSLDKSVQFSDWERRPLLPEQIHYAALDSHCLLQIYSCLKGFAKFWYPDCNLEPTLEYVKEQSRLERMNRKKKENELKSQNNNTC